MLLQEIRDGAVDAKTDIATVLRKSLVLATKLGHEGFKKWVEQELNGYKPDDELPPYRILHVQSLGHFAGPFGMQARNAPIPPRNVPEKWRKIVTTMPLVDAVAALVSLVESSKKKDLMALWPADLTAAMANRVYENMSCMQAWRVIPLNGIVGVIETVRNRLLSFVLEIENQNPDAGDAVPGAARSIPQERVNQYFHTYIMGGTNIALGSSGITQVVQQVQAGSLASLREHLEGFGVEPSDLDELESAIAQDPTPTEPRRFGPRVAGWIGKMTGKAVAGAWDVATSSAADLLTAAVKAYYDL